MTSARRLVPLLWAAAVLLALSGCGDVLFDEEPGAAAIRATYKAPVDKEHLGDVCDELGDSDGISQTSCSTTAAVFVFDEKATGSQVAEVSLKLRRMANVADVLVSVVGDSGDSVVRP